MMAIETKLKYKLESIQEKLEELKKLKEKNSLNKNKPEIVN